VTFDRGLLRAIHEVIGCPSEWPIYIEIRLEYGEIDQLVGMTMNFANS
jgi:hypothetical protein